MKRQYIWFIALIAVMAGIGAWYLYTTAEQLHGTVDKTETEAEPGVKVGNSAPLFALDSLDGQTVQVGKPGKPYILNFWASWCPPCRAEMPELNQFYSKYGSQVQFYAINLQESADKAAAFLQQNGYALPVLLDKNGTVAQTFRVTAIPTTIAVDARGIIRYRRTGGVTLSELEAILKGL